MHLSHEVDPQSATAVVRARLPRSVADSLALAADLTGRGGAAPVPGAGSTADLWLALATLAAHDVGAARAVEPHLDATAILDQAREAGTVVLPARASSAEGFTWGVFAAEGPGAKLVAEPAEPAEPADRVDPVDPAAASTTGGGAGDAARTSWTLSGTKPWCSLAGVLDGALVTAWVGDERRLFAVDLRQAGVEVVPGAWHARGLVEIPSGPVTFASVPATPVGEPGWYLRRPGFEWGGIAVAACWYGGAVGVAGALLRSAVARDPDPWVLRALGVVDERLGDARRALEEAAVAVDSGRAVGQEARLLAKRTRATVAHAAEDVLAAVGGALGPAPLASDPEHAKRVADLELYLRQRHASKDDASLGGAVRDAAVAAAMPEAVEVTLPGGPAAPDAPGASPRRAADVGGTVATASSGGTGTAGIAPW
ncbi:acyl-CoA dehydrogenase [Frigoribacterium sp. CFBP 8766]|uniref:acyl-CoA dehydrogenase n=1 Tax=Frigoribacterium sp. CFBP 8766 TaxID=2775273 RepID=UPI0017854791|nr:acyl-CoA dehydrogenase [Frigoribacterium sp. CFBP 8766]MBD8585802.1 acyl-CoA dehydrogenase [Frigoribacterium sp. CFBP 8766]